MKKIIIFFALILSFINCSDTETYNPPVLTTVDITDLSYNSVTSGGIITDDGGSEIIAKGICWSTTATPTINNNHTDEGTGLEPFTSNLTDLDENTTYYIRAFATNEYGTSYGNELSFTTLINVTAPCSPPANSIIYNSQNHTYHTVEASTNGLYGEYGLYGYGTISDLRIEFSQAPSTGIYTTLVATSHIGNEECVVSGTFSNFHYVASASQSVYVIKNGEGLYIMTFCDLNFISGSTSYTFNSDGNLKTE